MTPKQFLSMKIKLMPYCEYYYGSSTKYHESLHIVNKNTNKQLNLLFTKKKQTFCICFSP